MPRALGVLGLCAASLLGACGGAPEASASAAHEGQLIAAPQPVVDDALKAQVMGTTKGLRGDPKDPMSELLHWAVEHSDPERLKELMQKYQDENLTIKDVYGQDMLDALFVNEGGIMREAVKTLSDFRNASLPEEELEGALQRLQELVEQVDNAGNLHRMGGLAPLIELGVGDEGSRSAEVRALALWTLAVAVQNNAPVQEDLAALGALEALVGRLPRCTEQEGGTAGERDGAPYCCKLLLALSALVRNHAPLQERAGALGLFDWMLDVGMRQASGGVAKKSLGLLDTVLAQNPALPFLDGLAARHARVAAGLLRLFESEDADLAEKALTLVNRLVSLRPMLFGEDFRPALHEGARGAVARCKSAQGGGDEVCEGLASLARSADLALSARDVSDEEL